MQAKNLMARFCKILTALILSLVVIFPGFNEGHLSSVHAQEAILPAMNSQPSPVSTGDSGLSYRYVQTFGVTGVPYFADTTHLNRPIGLFMDGSNNLYVTEDYGQRVLKYDSTKANLLVLGQGGVCITDNYMFCSPKDIALDGAGNLWVADGNRIVEYNAAGTFLQQLPTTDAWTSGDDNTHFNFVNGIAFDGIGHMYVSDTNNHRVQVYTFAGGSPVYDSTIGITGVSGSDNDHFNFPYRLAVDSSNKIYVVDQGNNRVQQCEFTTNWACTTLDDGLNSPQGITADTADNIYIADLFNNRIRKCPAAGSCADFVTGTYGFYDLAVDSGGNVYGSATYEDLVVKYDSSGTFLGKFLGKKFVPYLTDSYHYYHPRVAIDNSNNIIIVEENGHRLTKLDANGVAQWSLGVPGVDAPDNQHFNYPHGVATDSRGRIYVADGCRVQIISPAGVYLNTLGTGCGTGDYEFAWVTGIDVDQNGKIYVADYSNHRVQIYSSARVFLGRIGVTAECSAANDHLCTPIAVATDPSGNIYVTDAGNGRIQKFDSSLAWQMTIGDGTSGSGFNQFAWAEDIVVDSQGRILVTDWTNNRVQVYDAEGGYLTTIGGSWGSNPNQLQGVPGVAVDSSGNVYVADWENHRIQKFTPGVPGWKQSNVNGFGDANTYGVESLKTFNNALYAGASNTTDGATIWRSTDGSIWNAVTDPGFDNSYGNTNSAVFDMSVFNGQIYAGTGWWVSDGVGGQIWRSSTGDSGTWTMVEGDGFGNSNNSGITNLTVFNNVLYATTINFTDGFDIWRSSTGDSGDWTQVASLGFGRGAEDYLATGLLVFDNQLYAEVEAAAGAQIWRSSTGNSGDWTQVNLDGFGDTNNSQTGGAAILNNSLYISTRNDLTGAQLWRSTNGSTWTQVMGNGFGDPNNYKIEAVTNWNDVLYAATDNNLTGLEVWRSINGTNWTQVNLDGFGSENNHGTLWSHAITEFNSELFLGTSGIYGQLWKYSRPVITNVNTMTDTGDGLLSENEQVIVPITKFTVTFNKDIHPPAIANFSLKNGATDIIINSVTYDSLTFTATLNVNNGNKLPYGTYALNITKKISDLNNNSMGFNFVRNFTLVKKPGVPLPISPINNVLLRNLQPKLDWSNSNIPTGTTFDHYQVQLSENDPDFGSPVDENVTISEFTPTSLLSVDTKYYWRVKTYNTLGQSSAWSAVQSFRESMLPPDLLAPGDGTPAGTLKPVFDWSDVVNNTGYTIQVSTSSGFTAFLINTDTATNVSTYTPLTKLPAGKTLYWRVRVKGPNGPSAWSSVFSFTTP